MLIVFSVSTCVQASGLKKDSVSNTVAFRPFDNAYRTWTNRGYTKYFMIVQYRAFSSESGTWQLWVDGTNVVKALLDDGPVSNAFMTSLTMDALFEKARGMGQPDARGLYDISVEYSPEGYIRLISVAVRKDVKNKPRDAGYRIEISELITNW